MANGKPIGTMFVELDLDTSGYTRKQKEIIVGSKTTSLEVEKNWRTIGGSSDKMYSAMRQNIQNSYSQIVNNAKSSADEIVRAERAKAAKLKAIDEQQYGAHISLTDQIKSNWLAVSGVIASAYAAFRVGKELVDASLQMERVNSQMQAVAGSATAAAREIQYIREESNRLGLVFADTASAFASFSASTRNTSIEGEQTRKIFSGVAEAVTALKLNAEKTSGVFLALGQMMSKGKVQAEELRGQLGERLPGAFKLAAEAMGVSEAELNKMLEQGQV